VAPVFEFEQLPLDLQHAEDVAALPVRDAISLPIPVELVQD
jgi:hypothetical protein